jgi:hypothetical protein
MKNEEKNNKKQVTGKALSSLPVLLPPGKTVAVFYVATDHGITVYEWDISPTHNLHFTIIGFINYRHYTCRNRTHKLYRV